MALHKVNKGLNLPIDGAPEQRIESGPLSSHVAIMADDFIGMRPTMHVTVGDEVRRGQLLFEDKKTPGVRLTAPASGKVTAIHRGERRRMQSLVIRLDQEEMQGGADTVSFDSYTGQHPSEMQRQQVKELLVSSLFLGLFQSARWECGRAVRP